MKVVRWSLSSSLRHFPQILLNFPFEQNILEIWQIITKGAILDRFLLIHDNKADVDEVGDDEAEVESKDGTPPNLRRKKN